MAVNNIIIDLITFSQMKSITLSKGKRQILELLRSADRPMTPAEIADRLKLKYGTVRNYVRELEQSGKIRKLGHGQYIYEENGEPGPKESAASVNTTAKDRSLVRVALIHPRAGAGNGEIPYDEGAVEDYLALDARVLRGELGFLPSRLVAMRVTGDSMEPTLRPGDVVIVAFGTDVLIQGALYLIRWEEGLMVKRLKSWDRKRIVFRSDNPSYDDLVVPQQEDVNAEILGRIVYIKRYA